MLTQTCYRKIVLASAWYDLVATIGFATPWTYALIHAAMVTSGAGLPGSFPPLDPVQMLMANLLGSIVTVWAVIRIRDPQMRYGRYDAVGRVLFATWQVYAVLHGASVIILAFTAIEILFGILQLLPVRPASTTSQEHTDGRAMPVPA